MRMPTTLARSFTLTALLAAAGGAAAQTPVANPMPDGSRDMYLGLGLQSTNRYEGGSGRHLLLMPVLQAEWSNGVFISGASAGMHWSGSEGLEYGPLLSLHPGRSERGRALTGAGLSGTGSNTALPPLLMGGWPAMTRMTGMPNVPRRLEAGAFLTWYLNPQWRLANSVLYGAGQERDGLRATLDLQRVAAAVAPHHTLSFTAGITLADANYNRALFGVTPAQELVGADFVRRPYAPGGGIKDLHAGVRWNWALAPSWMLTSGAHAARLAGDAKASPLVERPTSVTAWSALAYRF
jgi:outer membrane scaffolding protein for murein synthesis (MipA/OmpV family)